MYVYVLNLFDILFDIILTRNSRQCLQNTKLVFPISFKINPVSEKGFIQNHNPTLKVYIYLSYLQITGK